MYVSDPYILEMYKMVECDPLGQKKSEKMKFECNLVHLNWLKMCFETKITSNSTIGKPSNNTNFFRFRAYDMKTALK